MGLLEYGLLALVALAIAVSIQVVGIILVVAMLVTPAATAQLLTDRFGRMLLVAVGLSVVESVVGEVPWPDGFRQTRVRPFGRTQIAVAVRDDDA